jgi:hypothetical protein
VVNIHEKLQRKFTVDVSLFEVFADLTFSFLENMNERVFPQFLNGVERFLLSIAFQKVKTYLFIMNG